MSKAASQCVLKKVIKVDGQHVSNSTSIESDTYLSTCAKVKSIMVGSVDAHLSILSSFS